MKWTGHILLFLSISLFTFAALDLNPPSRRDQQCPFLNFSINDLLPLPDGFDYSPEFSETDIDPLPEIPQIEEKANSQDSMPGAAVPEWVSGLLSAEESMAEVILCPDPSQEVVPVTGSFYSGDRAMKTSCIPEPATWGLLVMGTLVLFGIPKRSFDRT